MSASLHFRSTIFRRPSPDGTTQMYVFVNFCYDIVTAGFSYIQDFICPLKQWKDYMECCWYAKVAYKFYISLSVVFKLTMLSNKIGQMYKLLFIITVIHHCLLNTFLELTQNESSCRTSYFALPLCFLSALPYKALWMEYDVGASYDILSLIECHPLKL